MANKIVKNCGFTHICLFVSDWEKSHRFYCEGLGMKETAAWGEPGSRACMLDLGDGNNIEMFEAKSAHGEHGPWEAGTWGHLALRTDDVEGAFEAAIKAGAREKSAPNKVALNTVPPTPLHVAFVYGPDGEEIEFFHVANGFTANTADVKEKTREP